MPALLAAVLTLAACSGNRRAAPSLTPEPAIERAFDVLSTAKEGKSLIAFLEENPVSFEFANVEAPCPRYEFDRRTIYLRREFGSDTMLALAVARAAQVYRFHRLTGLDAPTAEQEELAALFQARVGLQINLVNADFETGDPGVKEIKSSFCTYLHEGQSYAMRKARASALVTEQWCARPFETLDSLGMWLQRTRAAVRDENLFTLLYERDLQRVRRGQLTMADAMRNDARFRAMPLYEISRFQRMFYDTENRKMSKATRLYRNMTKEDASWRASHAGDITRARAAFATCGMPDLPFPGGNIQEFD
ncbi:MAG: hypothetical protein FD189_1612 [Elusimicrobia bacterium]|nr:MAG: hypothetical protein FD154_1821 [Elusimicrobiota bacterium]KAF0154946.1 MAG: hypothetical protein FD189_1612 [Elusimicrobiota bacterium]